MTKVTMAMTNDIFSFKFNIFSILVEINQRDCLGKQINGYQNLPNVPICHQGETEVEGLMFNFK